MFRELKQLIFGLIFLVIVGLIGWYVYVIAVKPAPTCDDEIQNQGETEIDCGGPCISCDLKNVKSLEQRSPVQYIEASSGADAFIAKVYNPNKKYNGDFIYRFTAYNEAGDIVRNISDKGFIYPLESRDIIKSGVFKEKIARVEFEINNVSWNKAVDSLKPSLELTNHSTHIQNNQAIVEGSVKNNSLLSGFDVPVSIFLNDNKGFNVFASQVILSDVESFADEEFRISIPVGNDSERIDIQKTKIKIYSSL